MSTFSAASGSKFAKAFVEFDAASYILPDSRFLLQNISLHLDQGTTTAFLGRSGSGKTTLLRMVNGMVMPTQGEVRVRGKATTAWIRSNCAGGRRFRWR
ncbi:MAG: ATP-binding cassette domain-containing protein [Acidobacteriaceae bacterium]